MRPEKTSQFLLKITRSKAKMYEYDIPESEHINPSRDPTELLTLTIGVLGELSARASSEGIDSARFDELQSQMLFAARYFDSYRKTKIASSLDKYLLLLGSTSYYLCNLPGSSKVLAATLLASELDLGANGLEHLLLWLVRGDFTVKILIKSDRYKAALEAISEAVIVYYQNGGTEDALFRATSQLRRVIYSDGSARELLLVDAIGAMARLRHENSSRRCLPIYSELQESDWASTLSKSTFIYELWPAQKLLGENGVFSGRSAVIQMPTSAGKSRATEITIRSAFISERASLAIIVAPFRALCHEIRDSLVKAFQGEAVNIDEVSDAFQIDFDIDELLAMRSILILTPEKLVYVLRHEPQLAKQVGLLVYDEGHQFDTGSRGVTYELLVTSLKTLVPLEVQTVLISAVLPNAESIGEWLNSDEPNVVSGKELIPTERTIAFASWQDQLGRLEFVDPDDTATSQFFVPRVIESIQLQHTARENPRLFPKKSDGKSIALYLGLKLVKNGSVAIFCGRKDTVVGMCREIIDAYDRGLSLETPLRVSSVIETQRIANLCKRNLGEEATVTQSAKLGIFTHHANTTHGIRLSVEHAMASGEIRFVICTSTLAQGVNLPIRYLIITSMFQGQEQLKIRDFHNLIGRTGRSGMHTEGSVIFSDPAIYDQQDVWRERWRWLLVQKLLRADNSEPCLSTLLSALKPLASDKGNSTLPLNPLLIVRSYVSEGKQKDWIGKMAGSLAREGFSQAELQDQIAKKSEVFAAIESFLMAHWDSVDVAPSLEGIRGLAEGTLAYHLADDADRENLLGMFQLLAENIASRVEEPVRRGIFSRTLLGVDEALEAESWVALHLDEIAAAQIEDELFVVLWPFLSERIQNKTFQRCRPIAVLKAVAQGWINGLSFSSLLSTLRSSDARLGEGKAQRKLTIEHVVEICENALGYDGALAIGTASELFNYLRPEDDLTLKRIKNLQKRMKHGLKNETEVIIYESGFADRVVADDISQVTSACFSRRQFVRELHSKENIIREKIDQHPGYFHHILNQILK